MVSKEEFNKVWKDSDKESILNQFYYEHIELRKMIDNFNELEKWLDAEIKRINDIKEGKGSKVKPYGEEKNNYQIMISGYKYCLNKLQELKGSGNNE